MMFDVWQLLLVFSAIAVGWFLGRGKRATQKEDAAAVHQHYYKGLNYLLNNQTDESLDTFIDSLEVNTETLSTHIAIGNLMRSKGEVESAIRIHQNLLARPGLTRIHLHQAHLELARDFISAGLWDRAERLLKDLLDESPELRAVSKRHLMEIYQDEKEWDYAIEMGLELLPKRSLLKPHEPADDQITIALSHYYCELAENSISKNNYLLARSHLKQAIKFDKQCVRASLLAADIEYKAGHYLMAIKHLRKVKEQDTTFIPETINLLKQSFVALGNEEEYLRYLYACLEEHPSATLLLTLTEHLKSTKGESYASEFLSKELKHRPSLRGLAKMVELSIDSSSGQSKESLIILQLLIEQLMTNKPQYQCHHCGFSGKQLHWLCPGCKQWGQMKAIRGAEGD